MKKTMQFDRADVNKDESISFEEFYSVMSTDSNNLSKNPILSKIMDDYHNEIIWELSSVAQDNIDGHSNIGQLCMFIFFLLFLFFLFFLFFYYLFFLYFLLFFFVCLLIFIFIVVEGGFQDILIF